MSTTPALITWPHLPHRSFYEHSFVQSASGFPGLVIDSLERRTYVDRIVVERELDHLSLAYLNKTTAAGCLKTDYAAGMAELTRLPSGWFEGLAVGSQQVGPISLSLQLTDEQQRPLVYDPMLLEALSHHLSLRVAWLSEQFTNLAEDGIIFLAEPFLDAFNSPFFPIDWNRGIELLELVFDGIKGCRGIIIGTMGTDQHRDTKADYWTPVLETSVELILLDVYNHSALLLDAAASLLPFLHRPGFIAWGLVPSDAESLMCETVDTLVERFQSLLQQVAAAGVPEERLLLASLISTSGSLEHLPLHVAERALRVCLDVSNRLRSLYHLA